MTRLLLLALSLALASLALRRRTSELAPRPFRISPQEANRLSRSVHEHVGREGRS